MKRVVTLLMTMIVAAIPCAAGRAQAQTGPRLALLEPARGTYFGVNLDWGSDSAAAFNQRLGLRAAVYVQFVRFPLTGDDERNLDGFVEQVAAQGGMATLTLEPFDGLDAVTPETAAAFAERLAGINARGVPVFLRFAHEMNGSWYPWSQQPTAYVRAFRTLATAVHSQAPSTAMLWAPNYGAGYPFRGGRYEAPLTSPDRALLDTNHDGRVDQDDDMYAPYYPGDDAVDWVGMSLYHWGDTYPWGKNVVPEEGKFAANLTGTYNGANGDERNVPNFYRDYVQRHGKPMAIVETAAFFNTTVAGDEEAAIKRLWWRQVYSERVAREFPGIKMINWFEWRKFETEVNGVVDWTITASAGLRDAFLADLPRDWFIFADDLGRAMR